MTAPLISLVAFARGVGMPYDAAWRLMAAGKLAAERLDGRWYVPPEELERFRKGTNGRSVPGAATQEQLVA